MEKMLKELKTDLDQKVAAIVDAMSEGKDQDTLDGLKKAFRTSRDRFNIAMADKYYKDLASQYGKDAVKVALTGSEELGGPNVPGVLDYKFKMSETGTVIVTETVPAFQINLPAMQAALGAEYFHAADWFARLSVLAKLIALALNKEICGSATYQYTLDEAVKTFELDEAADPTSKKSMVAAFQKVVDGIVWVDAANKDGQPVNGIKFINKDWVFISKSMTRHGGLGTLTFASPATCSSYIVEALHCIITNRGYRLKNESR